MRARLVCIWLVFSLGGCAKVAGSTAAQAPHSSGETPAERPQPELTGTAVADPWEVVVYFAGSAEPPDFQGDLDRNVLELARSKPNERYRVTVIRELADREVVYVNDPRSRTLSRWDPLFFRAPLAGFEVPGEIHVRARVTGEPSALASPTQLKALLASGFRNPAAHKLFVLYSHGLAYRGLKGISLADLQSSLSAALPAAADGRPPLDIFWLNACFMANIETVYQLRKLSAYTIASEEAEFSAGAPFETLETLGEGPVSPRAVATDLAHRYLDSYSYLQEGSQRDAVYRSSATVSVIENAKLPRLVEKLRTFRDTLPSLPEPATEALSRSLRKITTEVSELVDLGTLLLRAQQSKFTQKHPAREAAQKTLQFMERARNAELRQNPKLRVEAPVEGARLVFGYENWTKGTEADEDVLGRLPSELKPAGFQAGPKGLPWPYRIVRVRDHLAPFAVGLRRFDYFFADPRDGHALTPRQSFVRVRDTASFEARGEETPLIFSGYTQGSGAEAQKYTGLSVVDPTIGLPSVDYPDLDFAAATGWGQF